MLPTKPTAPPFYSFIYLLILGKKAEKGERGKRSFFFTFRSAKPILSPPSHFSQSAAHYWFIRAAEVLRGDQLVPCLLLLDNIPIFKKSYVSQLSLKFMIHFYYHSRSCWPSSPTRGRPLQIGLSETRTRDNASPVLIRINHQSEPAFLTVEQRRERRMFKKEQF